MEIHSNFYFKHPDKNTHKRLLELLSIGDLNSKTRISDINERNTKIIEIAEQINSKNGKKLSENLLSIFDNNESFGSESIKDISGFCVSHWVNSSIGFEVQESLMLFFYKLCPEIHAQSWSCGDDDPLEVWYKYENKNIHSFSDSPYSENDDFILGTIYRWWHSTMPNSIKEGHINDGAYPEICEEIFEKSFLLQTEVTDIDYNTWLNDQTNQAIVKNNKEYVPSSNDQSEYSELIEKINTKLIIQLIIFSISLLYLIWVFFIK